MFTSNILYIVIQTTTTKIPAKRIARATVVMVLPVKSTINVGDQELKRDVKVQVINSLFM